MDSYIQEHLDRVRELELWLDDRLAGLDPKEAVVIARALDERVKALGIYADEMRRTAANHLHEAGIKTATVQDGDKTFAVKVVNRSRRSEVNRDDLVRDIERLAADPVHRLDASTGELGTIEQARRSLIAKVFRFEPRWAEVTKLGLQEDEYCSRTWSRNIEMEEVVEL